MKGMIIMIGGQWLKVPCKAFTDSRLSRGDIAVLAYICDRLKEHTASISLSDVAEACELSKRTAIRAVDKLCECNYLRADKRAGKPTLYTQLCIPSKSTQKRPERTQERGSYMDTSKYDFVINNFPEEEEQA
jgi:hypothetical protein